MFLKLPFAVSFSVLYTIYIYICINIYNVNEFYGLTYVYKTR